MEVLKDIGTLFYLVSPAETSFQRVEDIPKPNYTLKAIPYFITFIVLEYIVQILQNKRRTRINDGITSMATGVYLALQDILSKGVYHYVFIKVYENWRLVDLPWDSPVTWWLAAIGVDFIFYWIHRASHELNFLWAHHQVHHSSEDYNLTTALRQPAAQVWFVFFVYLPLAFFIPPTMMIVHQQFNLLYQFWIHTEVIEDLGPLEWILNTPKHHSVHHGSNRYCLDKNYAGWLIIWDRLFGTFEEKRSDEKIVYGLVEDVKSFNPFYLQFFYVPKIWNRMKSYDNWGDKLSVLFKGPGWTPGSTRLGDINEVPVYPTREIHDIQISTWKNVYVVVHFVELLLLLNTVASNEHVGQGTVLMAILFILSSLTSLGFILENRTIGVFTEMLRCGIIAYLLHLQWTPGFISTTHSHLTMYFFGISALIWTAQFGFNLPKSAHVD